MTGDSFGMSGLLTEMVVKLGVYALIVRFL